MPAETHSSIDCPVCQQPLQPLAVGEVVVDVCHEGCGGIWFDLFELQKLDEEHEPEGDLLAHVQRHPDLTRDPMIRLNCPRCRDVVLRKHFFSITQKVEVDSCPGCGGYWLDHGELAGIRSEFSTAEARASATRAFLEDLDDRHVQAACPQALERSVQVRSLSAMFRIMGSRYVS